MNLTALILAGGRGKRMEMVTSSINKCMLPFNGKPLISYSLENAARAGVSEMVIVVGYRAEDIINYFGNRYQNICVKYVIQREQKGIVHAIESARDTIDGADFMSFLGDEILVDPRHEEMMNLFCSSGSFVICGVTRARNISDISKTYAIIQDQTSNIYRLIEKPRKPLNDIMGTGNCIFKNGIFDYIPYTPVSHNRGEKELVDMIQCAIDEGEPVKSFNIGSGYININTEEDIAAAEKLSQQLLEMEDA